MFRGIQSINRKPMRLVVAICVMAGALMGTPVVASAAPITPVPKTSQTYQNLMTAMHGEAFAYAKYSDFASVGQQEGLPPVSSLFSGTARMELTEHLAEEAEWAGLVGTDAQNLQDAIDGELYETTTMYPGFAAAARMAGDTVAADLFADVGPDESGHAAAFQKALDALNKVAGATVPDGPVAVMMPVVPGPAKAKSQQTLDNLSAAMHGEAFAYAKYSLYAEAAYANGNTAIGDLFAATAKVERYEHFREEAAVLGLYGDSAANLADAIAGETYEKTTMYPDFAATATAEGYAETADLFTEIAGDEAGHAAAFQALLAQLQTVPAGGLVIALSSKTYQNLLAAMHGEAFANAKYTDFASVATAAGLTDVAALFTKTGDQELNEHFAEEADALGLVGTDAANLQDAIAGELHETQTAYPMFASAAEAAGDTAAADLWADVGSDEAGHAAAFQQALDALNGMPGARIPAGPVPVDVPVATGAAQAKSQTTLDNLSASMHGEAFAYAKYSLYAAAAYKNGNTALGDLFAKTAEMERYEHLREFAAVAGLFGDTAANLKDAIAGETYETTTMYPGFAKEATAEGYTAVAALFTEIAGDEAMHAAAFQKALDALGKSGPVADTGGQVASTPGFWAAGLLMMLLGAVIVRRRLVWRR